MNRIHELRKARRMSQAKLAQMLHVHQTAVSSWESGATSPNPETEKALADVFGVTIEYLRGYSDNPAAGNWIPVYGNVAAGIPIEEIEDIVDMEEIPESWVKDGSKYMALRIHGESMQPQMKEGDHVLVRRQPDVESGEIAIVRVNGDKATCKKIKKTADGIYLLSLNPAFEPIYYTREEIETLPVQILGRVVELRAKF